MDGKSSNARAYTNDALREPVGGLAAACCCRNSRRGNFLRRGPTRLDEDFLRDAAGLRARWYRQSNCEKHSWSGSTRSASERRMERSEFRFETSFISIRAYDCHECIL